MSVFVVTENKGALNLRKEPSTSSEILTRIPYAAEVPAEKIDDTWAKVRYNDYEGYAMIKFLSTEAPVVKTISKNDLRLIYDKLKSTLELIEEVLK